MQKQKLNELFIMTSFLCCFVILIHISSYPVGNLLVGSWQHRLFFLGNKSLSFVVPGFVFLSGLKLTYAYAEKDFDFFEFLQKRLLKILLPYAMWYVAYYILLRYLGYIEPKSIQQHLFSIIMGDLVSPFYFITIIFQFYVLFGIILFFFKKYNHRWILLLTVVVEFLYLQYTYLPYEDRFFMTYLLYFVMGCYTALHLEEIREKTKQWQGILIGSFLFLLIWHTWHAYQAVLGTPYFGWRILGCLFSITAIYTLYRISMVFNMKSNKLISQVFQSIDKASYEIFLAHCFILYVSNEFWSRIGIASIVGKFVLNVVVVFFITFSCCILGIRIKKWIFHGDYTSRNG